MHRRPTALYPSMMMVMGLSTLLPGDVMPLIRAHGVLGIGLVTLLESSGLPLPGETAVIATALYAADTHAIGIVPLVAAAAAGAIIGDNVGYLLGRQVGYRLIRRYGSKVGLTDARLKLGRYLFKRQGSKIVFFGRFVAVLRTFTALLAGANHMDWRRFLVFNTLGGTLWASLYGFGAYLLGREVERLERPMAIGLGVVAVIVACVAVYLTRKHGAALQREAERAYPDLDKAIETGR